jgi:GDPmannose 4,6-dehydratase
LGNLDARRDWGYAPEYMEAAWMMLQQDKPGDYVIGTGESHSVKDFVEKVFEFGGIKNWQDYVEVDPRYYRPTEVESLIADASKAKKEFGWEPKVKFDDLARKMAEYDFKKEGLILEQDGKWTKGNK